MAKPTKPPTELRRPPPPTTVGAGVPADAAERFLAGGEASTDIPGQPQRSTGGRATRAEAGTKTIVTRSDGRRRRRMMVYLEEDVAELLETVCRDEGREMSATINRAVRRYLAGLDTPRRSS